MVSPIDLRAQESSKIQVDTLQVLAVRGIAQTQKLLKVGDQVFSGEVVELDKDSEVILGAPDQSAFQINSYAIVQPIPSEGRWTNQLGKGEYHSCHHSEKKSEVPTSNACASGRCERNGIPCRS